MATEITTPPAFRLTDLFVPDLLQLAREALTEASLRLRLADEGSERADFLDKVVVHSLRIV